MDTHKKAREALALLGQMKSALQEAHFAARRMDEVLASGPRTRSADEIHRLRIALGELTRSIQAHAS